MEELSSSITMPGDFYSPRQSTQNFRKNKTLAKTRGESQGSDLDSQNKLNNELLAQKQLSSSSTSLGVKLSSNFMTKT